MSKKIQPSCILLLAGLIALSGCGGSAESTSSGDAPASVATPAAGEVVLTTEIPDEVLEGTPQPIEGVPQLETAPTRAPTLSVPEGTVLLSKGKPVTSSDDMPFLGELGYLTDGDKEGGEGYYVELMDGLQWAQIDLEAEASIEAIWIWHFHSQRRAYHDVIVQLSNDPEFKDGVTTLFNNDSDNSSGIGKGRDNPYVETRFGKLIDGNSTKARYVRLYSNGNTTNDQNHYIEVEVFGVPGS